MARAQVHERVARPQQTLEQKLDAPTRRLVPDDTRRQHTRVVEHEQIAGAEQRRQVGEQPILDTARGTVEHEQAARAPLPERRLRDQLRRKFVVEVAALHRGAILTARWRLTSGARGRSRTDTLIRRRIFVPLRLSPPPRYREVRGLEHAFTLALRP